MGTGARTGMVSRRTTSWLQQALGPLGATMAIGVIRVFSRAIRYGDLIVVYQNEDFEARMEAVLEVLGESPYRRLVAKELRRVIELPAREVYGTIQPSALFLGRHEWLSDKHLWAVGLIWFAAWNRAYRRGSVDPSKMAMAWVERVRALSSMRNDSRSADVDGLVRALTDGRLIYP